MWTGCRPMDILTVNDRCFIISKDDSFINNVYEVNPNTTYDTDADGTIRYVNSILYTKEYDCKTPYNNKALHSIELGIKNVQGDFKISVDYRPSHGNRFDSWGTFEHAAPWRSCLVPEGCAANGLDGHSFRDLIIGNPINPGCDPVSAITYDIFRKIQLRFTITGKYWELNDYELRATPQPQSQQTTVCGPYNSAKLCTQCNNDWYIGPFKSCLIQKT